MATHASTVRTVDRLARLLTYFENNAAAVRAVLALLEDDPTRHVRTGGIPSTLRAAVALDATRRAGNGNGNGHHADRDVIRGSARIVRGRPKGTGKGTGKRRAPGHASAVNIRAQRERTAAYLAQFDANEPRVIKGRLLGAIVRRGYLKKRRGGYVRTAKPFVVDLAAD